MSPSATPSPAVRSKDITQGHGLWLLLLAALLAAPITAAQVPPTSGETKGTPIQIVLVELETVTPAAVSQWKKERFNAVAVVLDDRASKAACLEAVRHISDGGLDPYWWIEVARNPKMAAAHPRWMAALGMHADWLKNFPNFAEPGADEVAKAFPWVPIGYRESFDAHLERIEQLLKRVPPGWRGLLLNDLQAGPSSCGCGNLQCRWAIDYDVRPTATKLEGDDVAVRFIAEVRNRVGDGAVIPVWTTECEEVDLPPDKHQGRPGTGLCGTVGCATGACPEVFTKQWSALASGHDGPIGLLALHTALQRTQKEFGGGPGWATNTIEYLDKTVPTHGGKSVLPKRLWMVVEGLRQDEEATGREAAAKAGVAAVIVARVRIEQSYEPRMLSTK
ncbi:MAG TPA: hypothetical protein VJW76_09935 [Verrucomicrobiae bacterium]|nr:hypothetical protein [Verrucomicrobiae bacterium]